MLSLKLLGLAVVVLAVCAGWGYGADQVSEIDARSRVCEYVRARKQFQKNEFLRAIRREDLEEDLFANQRLIHGKIRKAAMFFEVSDTGYEILSQDEVIIHISEAPRRWVVAIDSSNGRIFGLYGFDDGTDAFNSLAAAADIWLKSDRVAQTWISFYIQVVLGNVYGDVLEDPLNLRHRVEVIDQSYSSSRKRPFSPSRWMRNLKRSGVKPRFGVQVRREGEVYHVEADMLRIADDKTPFLQRMYLEVSTAGSLDKRRFVRLFPK